VPLTSIELCAGAGGQALGLEQAGFRHLAVVELDHHACATLRVNRPYWNTVQEDVTAWHAERYRGQVDLLAAGVPCPPFSKAGRQLGADDVRDLFPHALRIVREHGSWKPDRTETIDAEGREWTLYMWEVPEGVPEELLEVETVTTTSR
jgi:site-specific DNA-cytosine methylase